MRLTPIRTATYEVGPKELTVLVCIELPFTFISTRSIGESLFTSLMIKWLVVDVPSAYNAIIGRFTQTVIYMRTDSKYLTLIFENEDGDASIYIDQKEARSMMKIAQKTTTPEALRNQEGNKIETKKVQLTEDFTTRVARILPEDTKAQLVNLLQMNKDLFSYSPSDMPNVNPKITQHSLYVNPKCET